MWQLVLLASAAILPLAAMEMNEVQRTEDWELQLTHAGRLAKEQQFDDAHALYQTLSAAADKFGFPLLLKAKCLNNHGALLYLSGKYAEAEAKYKEAARFWISAAGAGSDEHASTLNNLGELYRLTGRYAEAEETFRSSLRVREQIARHDQLRLAAALNNLATAQIQTARIGDRKSVV